jgi:hypothetical protein
MIRSSIATDTDRQSALQIIALHRHLTGIQGRSLYPSFCDFEIMENRPL